METTDYEAVIIGAGMSGLAAGIRLALFGKRVLLLERHKAFGGLNSFYGLGGRRFDVGLHALTNFVKPSQKGTPLAKLFRQLRIDREALVLGEQGHSRICVPGVQLTFSNQFEELDACVRQQFPAQILGWERLQKLVREFDAMALDAPAVSARSVIKEYISDPQLVDSLLLPLFFYGSAVENDMDLAQFVILFRSIYLEGFARPYDGVRSIIRLLVQKYVSCGGQFRLGCGVRRLVSGGGRIQTLELDDGSVLKADTILSSAGRVETMALCGDTPVRAGHLSFVEAIRVLNVQPQTLGWGDTIVFFSDHPELRYECPKALWDPYSGVICVPNNYQFPDGRTLEEGWLRITALANHAAWKGLPRDVYLAQKAACLRDLTEKAALRHLPPINRPLEAMTVATDVFTPLTVERFTGHVGGTVYGTPHKTRDGRTPYENLFIIGTDQGFLGIIGAMLSGISLANLHVLKASI